MYCYCYVDTVHNLYRKELGCAIEKIYQFSGICTIILGQITMFSRIYWNVLWPGIPSTIFCVLKLTCDHSLTWYFYRKVEKFVQGSFSNEAVNGNQSTVGARLRKLRSTLFVLMLIVGCGISLLMKTVVSEILHPYAPYNVPVDTTTALILLIEVGALLLILYISGPVVRDDQMEVQKGVTIASVQMKEEPHSPSHTSDSPHVELPPLTPKLSVEGKSEQQQQHCISPSCISLVSFEERVEGRQPSASSEESMEQIEFNIRSNPCCIPLVTVEEEKEQVSSSVLSAENMEQIDKSPSIISLKEEWRVL